MCKHEILLKNIDTLRWKEILKLPLKCIIEKQNPPPPPQKKMAFWHIDHTRVFRMHEIYVKEMVLDGKLLRKYQRIKQNDSLPSAPSP